MAVCPSPAAQCNAVISYLFLASVSAPAATVRLTSAARLSRAASYSTGRSAFCTRASRRPMTIKKNVRIRRNSVPSAPRMP